MHRISKRIEFSASHILEGLADDHPCSRLHGHNYAVEVEVEGTPDPEVGFVLDYHALGGVKRWADDTLDHRHLNDVFEMNPTAENLASYIFGIAPDLIREELDANGWVAGSWSVSAVRVYETPKTCAEFRLS